MSRYLKWLFRPVILIVVSVALVGAAAVVVLQPAGGPGQPQPAPIGPNEQEVAFLYPATSTVWERFVSAVERSRGRLEDNFPGLRFVADAPADRATSSVPQVALQWPAAGEQPAHRLVFRWYKLTSDWRPHAWVEALLARRPPPLAIIGGNNSFWAREQAIALERLSADLPPERRPLLLLTTATADKVAPPDSPGPDAADAEGPGAARLDPLHSLYPGRTFRFCFTNRQMATAVTRFLWGRLELRPDSDPAYLAQWDDDAYSRDLVAGYLEVLPRRARDNAVQQLAWSAGGVALGDRPALLAGLLHAGWQRPGFRLESFWPLRIASSVGSFAAPNPYEAEAVRGLLDMMRGSRARRPLLVVTGQSAPSRRFLRDLARSAPVTSRRFVVAMGDAVAFNTIYRDRLVTWPIQELPFDLVFFCHRNPINPEAGFRPRPAEGVPRPRTAGVTTSASGTEDLLLHGDIVEALALAYHGDGTPSSDAADLARELGKLRQVDGRFAQGEAGVGLFHPDGQRQGGTGEHVVHVRPRFQGDRVLPEAMIEVWRRGDRTSGRWLPVGAPLTVSYDEYKVHGDRSHGND